MSDLREQLKKAGLVTDKQLRQARHQERVHASQVGREGILAERSAAIERLRLEDEERKRLDREREEQKRRKQEEDAARNRIATLIQTGWIREATAGARRYFFELPGGRVTFLDLTEQAMRQVGSGGAAIARTMGHVRGEFCVITATAAAELQKLGSDALCCWHPPAERRGRSSAAFIDDED
jgi:uncharacterized protein YaiL (DUF2058 family)